MKLSSRSATFAAGLVLGGAALLGVAGAPAPAIKPAPGFGGITLKKLKFTFETSNVHEAGTDADIYIAISYRTPSECGGSLFLLPTHQADMEKGRTDTYSVNLPPGCKIDEVEMDRIAAITVINGMNRDRPGWHIASLEIKGYASDGHSYLLASGAVGRWLDAASGEGPALPVALRPQFQDLGAGDIVGETKPWKVMKPSTGNGARHDEAYPG